MSTSTPKPPLAPEGPPTEQDIPPRSAPQKSHRLWLIVGLGGLAFAFALAASVDLLLQGGSDSSLTNTHAAATGEPALTSVPGYAYENPTGDYADLSQMVDEEVAAVNDETAAVMPASFGDFFLSTSGHQVMSGAAVPDALLYLSTVNPAVEEMPGFDTEDLVSGMAAGAAGEGATVTMETIAGEDVVTSAFDGQFAISWYHDGTLSQAIGRDESTVRDFTAAYLTQVNG